MADGYRYDQDVNAIMGQRSAGQDAAFLLPHLRPGMTLLDVGCGPGSVSLGLAAAVAPGEVVGVDIAPEQVERARTLAARQGATNVRFEVGDARALPFPAASFDVVFANAVLCHLAEPRRALEQFRRVLRPGGLAAVRDPDFSTMVAEPFTPGVQEFLRLQQRYMELKESPYYARGLRRLLLDAGFAQADGSADALQVGTLERSRTWAAGLAAALRSPDVWDTILARGWSDPTTLESIVAEWLAWGERPDAFSAFVWCSAIGRVGETART
jgi:ubiquinone/menaquinone biosynthesis C-methylase UbiE